MNRQKLMNEILRDMLKVAFEKIGAEIMKEHPEFTEEEIKQEANRLTTIYLENYDREKNVFDMELIQRISGFELSGD